jgi:hypothetical protein
VADLRFGHPHPLFPGLTRHVEVDAANVLGAIDSSGRWPGLRDRLVGDGAAQPHPRVRRRRARRADTPVAERSRLDVIAAISGG